MKRSILVLASLVIGCSTPARHVDPVKRGEYLVTTMGCNDCHTPMKFDPALGMPVPDRSRLLSGHPAGGPEAEGTVGQHDMGLIGPTFTAFNLPFGTVYSRNLTPDPDTGLGSWTEEEFIKTMRTGKWKGIGRPLLPPMPWMNLNAATDDDLRAIFAYLKSIPAMRNEVPNAKVPDPVIGALGASYEKITKRL